MKIVVLGTRGIPNIQGGVETHCQALYPRIVDKCNEVVILTRKPYTKQPQKPYYYGVRLIHRFAPKSKSLEAIVHTFLGVIYARFLMPDILHIHAIGPSLFVPFAKLLGLTVVVTNHGPDYDRQKWGKAAKFVLKLGEKWGTKYANRVIVISQTINEILRNKYGRNDCVLIPNGISIPSKTEHYDYIESLGLVKGLYVIAVGRFVEEKGFHDLIEAFRNIASQDIKLVLVGDADHETSYSKKLIRNAEINKVVLTGFITGEKLNQIFSHAKLFVIPSYHEGHPIALLEALGYGVNVIASDIPANREIPLNKASYFTTGDVDSLTIKLTSVLQEKSEMPKHTFLEQYNWDTIAVHTLKLYQEILR